ncbi:DoxX family protein [Bacillus sp. 1P06AnD]|uniref:DoxX family protein n=1 Tax=Bacillus sp. 1P06AnD TaxID=3132208 RepID=UPI0039A0E03C
MNNWKNNPAIGAVFAVLRIYLGYQWIKGGIEKVTGTFDASGFLQGALAKSTGDHPAVQGWYASFLEKFALPNVDLFNILIPWGELLVGIGLILGCLTVPALIAGAFMNLNFLLAGTVSTNPILYTLAMILLFGGSASYYFGLDRFIWPLLRNRKTNNTDFIKRAAS